MLSPAQLMLIIQHMNQKESLPSMSSESGLLQFCSVTLMVYFSKPVGVQLLSCVHLFVIPWTVACQDPLSMGFSRQEYWSGLSFPSPGDLPNPGIESMSPALPADSLMSKPPGRPTERESKA